MARRRKKTMTSRFRGFKKHYSRHKESYGEVGTILGAMAYGAVREKAAVWIAPLTARIPLGNASDEVALGASAWILNKFVGRKVPLLKPVFKGAMIIESARIGELIANGNLGIGNKNSMSSSGLLG
jgi:hypothetical protein